MGINWSSLLKHSRNRSVFFKYVMSYLIILLIPILIGTNQYYKTQHVLVDDATELNLHILRMSQDIVDRLFLEVDDVVSAISVDNDVLTQLQNTNDPPTAEQIYSYSLLRNSLNRYIFTNKFFFDIFLTFNNSGQVVTSKTSFDLKDNSIRINDQPFADWVEDVSKRSNEKQYYNLDRVTIGSETYKLIAYVSPLPNGFQGKVQGSIIVFIDQNNITSLFQRLVVKNGGFAYIQDPRGQVIAATSQAGVLSKLQNLPNQSSGSVFESLGGSSMLVSYSRSDQNGWTYIAALPSAVVLAKAEYIKRTIIVIALITLVLGCVAALLLAYRNSKPISELMDSVSDFVKGENGKRAGVYEILQNTVTDIINHNRILNSHMEQQLPLLQLSVMERILKGYYKTEEHIRIAMSQAQIVLRGENCFVVALAAYKEEMPFPFHSYSADAAVQDYVLRQIQVLMEGYEYLICMNGNRADVIVTLTDNQAEQQRAALKRRWDEAEHNADGPEGLRLVAGVGRMTGVLADLWRSHDEARQALEYYVPGERLNAIWYEDLPQGSGYYYYPIDLELKLIHAAKTGDVESLMQLLQHLWDENWSRRQLTAASKRQLLTEVSGTLHKLLEQMAFASDAFSELNEKLSDLNLSEEALTWSSLQEALRIICTHMEQGKKQKYNKTAEAMMNIVHEQFTDPNISLAALADHFKLSESFMSVLFKEHAGDNFSDYVERLRMDRACAMLKETSKNVNDIALEVGYNSDKTFRRAFKRVTGIQPTSYRDSLKA